jgi:hypothetical protein
MSKSLKQGDTTASLLVVAQDKRKVLLLLKHHFMKAKYMRHGGKVKAKLAIRITSRRLYS